MEHRRLGRTGLHLSALGLGTMTWGSDTDEHEAKDLLTEFLDVGGSLLDTAPGYGQGGAEDLIGELIGKVVDRRDVILMTKGGVSVDRSGKVRLDASRRTLIDSLDDSLQRLGTSTVDLFLVQAPDPYTELDEVAGALEHIVASGRAHYVGLSNFAAWQVGYLAGALSTPLALVQSEYSLVHRAAEDELLPACQALGAGFIGWAGLGRGVLTGKYRHTVPADSRAATAHLAAYVEPYLSQRYSGIIEAVATAAQGLDVPPLQVAAAWAQAHEAVSSILVGPRTAAQLRPLLAGDFELPNQIREALSEASEL
ncbi:aldo/keto reductase [Bowdeniella nasicola]|uniref:Aldo/keto reductase n=1 Tax=Bowdeniella nasicola TaxID=208480 RepID=A0A1Q5Q4W1_9ACTO|nr:aldo/keto reductase [Bowdeniella nasicola]OKL54867.1 aldo/keto reductase [Bowdeniella nasicola]